MASITIEINHELTQMQALSRIKSALKDAKKKYGSEVEGLTETWKGNVGSFSLTLKGQDIKGSVTVGAPTIILEGDVPRMFLFFKGRIEKAIRKEAAKILST